MQPQTQDTSYLGPLTQRKLLPGISLFSARCGYETLYDAGVLTVVIADIVLTIFMGLDLIDRGVNNPWLQFAYIAAVATGYSFLCVAALAMYRMERVLRFRYRWVMSMTLTSIISWTTFGLFASWIGWYGGESSTPSEGAAFITWIGINAAGVCLFMLRFLSIVMAMALHYTFLRFIELACYATSAGAQGVSLDKYLILRQNPNFTPNVECGKIDVINTNAGQSIYPQAAAAARRGSALNANAGYPMNARATAKPWITPSPRNSRLGLPTGVLSKFMGGSRRHFS
jgi:hypothetical protein